MKLYSLINYMNYFSSFCFLYTSNEKTKKCSIPPQKSSLPPHEITVYDCKSKITVAKTDY